MSFVIVIIANGHYCTMSLDEAWTQKKLNFNEQLKPYLFYKILILLNIKINPKTVTFSKDRLSK